MSTADDLIKKFGIKINSSEAVAQLSKLVSSEDDQLEKIAKFVSSNKELTTRLLRVANARRPDDMYTEVDQVIFRMGIGCAMLIAMEDPLVDAIIRTFDSMLGMNFQNVDNKLVTNFDADQVVGHISFAGKKNGSVYLRFTQAFAKQITIKMLQIDPAEAENNDVVTDTVGEISNMVVGNFKSNLCDAGLTCKLSVPTVSFQTGFDTSSIPAAGHDCLAFKSDSHGFFADIAVES